MSSFGNQGAGFYAGTNWGNPYGGRYYSPSGVLTGSTGLKGGMSPLDAVAELAYSGMNPGVSLSEESTPTDGVSSLSGGLGLGKGVGTLASIGTGMALGRAGMPGPLSGALSGLAGKAVGQETVTMNDLANLGISAFARAALPGVFAGIPGLAIGIGMNMLGINPASLLGRALGVPEMMSESDRASYVGGALGLDLSDQRGISFDDYGNAMLAGPTPGYDDSLGSGIGLGGRGQGIGVTGIGVSQLGLDGYGGLQSAMNGSFPGLETTVTEAEPSDTSTTSGGWGAGLSDGMSGGFSDGQAGDPWKSGGLVQYSEWKKRRC